MTPWLTFMLGIFGNRRQFLQVGGVGAVGLSLAQLLEARASERRTSDNGFGKAKSVVVLHLYGSPSQMDTFDPKPDAPAEARGEFKTIATRMAGVRICEHLPRMAGLLDRTALIRSMTHPYPTHGVAYTLSGIPINPERDVRGHWPFYGSVLDYLWAQEQAKQTPGVPRNMCLPWQLHSHSANKSHRGLHAAWLGRQWESIYAEFEGKATRAEGAPSADGNNAIRSKFDPHDGITPESTFRFTVPTVLSHSPADGILHDIGRSGVDLPKDVSQERLTSRRDLLKFFDDSKKSSSDRFQQMAFDMILSPKCANALDITREPRSVREKYGFTLFGQGCLAARRLVEAGVRVVTVYWDEFGPANTGWDTHANNFPRLKEGLCPTLDQVLPAFLDDMQQRGLLDKTLVVMTSEHGRTPKLANVPGGGRDHWSYAYFTLLAGAGVKQGTVVGATDRQGGYPIDRPINPKDVLATMYHLLGFDPSDVTIPDREGRPTYLLPYGEKIPEVLA